MAGTTVPSAERMQDSQEGYSDMIVCSSVEIGNGGYLHHLHHDWVKADVPGALLNISISPDS